MEDIYHVKREVLYNGYWTSYIMILRIRPLRDNVHNTNIIEVRMLRSRSKNNIGNRNMGQLEVDGS